MNANFFSGRPHVAVVACLVGAWLYQAPLATAAETPESDAPLEQAMAAYETNHWQKAFSALALLADAGHGAAARVALLMARHGPALYRDRFELTTSRRSSWLDHATRTPITAQAGSATSAD